MSGELPLYRPDDEEELPEIEFTFRLGPGVELPDEANVLFDGGQGWDLRDVIRLSRLKEKMNAEPPSELDRPVEQE